MNEHTPRIRAYIAARPANTRRELKKIRAAVRAAAPKAVERFSYGIPGFTLNGKSFVWYAAWKHHVSLYPMSSAIRNRFKAALEGCETSTGTIRFPLDNPPSAALIKRLAQARAADMRKANGPRGA